MTGTMESSLEWYIHSGTAQEGPFSGSVILSQIASGKIHPETLLWKQGMAEWAQLKNISELNSKPQVPPHIPTLAIPTFGATPVVTSNDLSAIIHISRESAVLEDRTGVLNSPKIHEVTLQATKEARKATLAEKRASSSGEKSKTGPLLILLLIVAAGAYGYFNQAQLKNVLMPLMSPIPSIAELSPEEVTELRVAASADLSAGPKSAIIKSGVNAAAPIYYVSSNLGENEVLEMSFDGDLSTLLDLSAPHRSVSVPLKKYWAKVDLGEFKPLLTTGQYKLTLLSSQKIKIGERSDFLGGVKNDGYKINLKKYHDSFLEQAKAETTREEQLLNIWDALLLFPKDSAKATSFTSEVGKFQPNVNGKYFFPQLAQALQDAAKIAADSSQLEKNVPKFRAAAQEARVMLRQIQEQQQKPDYSPLGGMISPTKDSQ